MFEFNDLWFRYSKEYIIKGASGSVQEGKALAIVGPTGCGKSTLLLLLSGLLKPERGVVRLNGERPKKSDLGLLFQNPEDQLFNPTVYDEIAYALRTMGLDESEIKEKVMSVANEMGIDNLMERSPHKLSVGQKKLVALASILVYEPKVLLLDEPSANLDAESLRRLVEAITRRKKEGRIIVFSTHDPDFALEFGNEICEMVDGRLKCMDTLSFLDKLLRGETSLPVGITLRALKDKSDLKNAIIRLRRS